MPYADYNAKMAEYMLRRYHQRREAMLWLLGDVCEYCRSSENLNFDHRRPEEKSFPISKLWSINEKAFVREIFKCHLLCERCHIEKTRRNNDQARGRLRSSMARAAHF